MGAALAYRKRPRELKRKRGTIRPMKRGKNILKMLDKGLVIDLTWTEASLRRLQKACYHLRMAQQWTQEQLAKKCIDDDTGRSLCTATITRYEDIEQPFLRPQMRTTLIIFKKAFHADITIRVTE